MVGSTGGGNTSSESLHVFGLGWNYRTEGKLVYHDKLSTEEWLLRGVDRGGAVASGKDNQRNRRQKAAQRHFRSAFVLRVFLRMLDVLDSSLHQPTTHHRRSGTGSSQLGSSAEKCCCIQQDEWQPNDDGDGYASVPLAFAASGSSCSRCE